MKFRTIADADIEAVIGLWTRCGLTRPWNDPHRDIAFARSGSNSEILVGERDSKLLVALMLGHDGHRGTLYYVAVEPDAQREGVGRAAVQAAEQWLRAKGVWKMNILVRHGNDQAKAFYEALGYKTNDVSSMGRWIEGDSTFRPV